MEVQPIGQSGVLERLLADCKFLLITAPTDPIIGLQPAKNLDCSRKDLFQIMAPITGWYLLRILSPDLWLHLHISLCCVFLSLSAKMFSFAKKLQLLLFHYHFSSQTKYFPSQDVFYILFSWEKKHLINRYNVNRKNLAGTYTQTSRENYEEMLKALGVGRRQLPNYIVI